MADRSPAPDEAHGLQRQSPNSVATSTRTREPQDIPRSPSKRPRFDNGNEHHRDWDDRRQRWERDQGPAPWDRSGMLPYDDEDDGRHARGHDQRDYHDHPRYGRSQEPPGRDRRASPDRRDPDDRDGDGPRDYPYRDHDEPLGSHHGSYGRYYDADRSTGDGSREYDREWDSGDGYGLRRRYRSRSRSPPRRVRPSKTVIVKGVRLDGPEDETVDHVWDLRIHGLHDVRLRQQRNRADAYLLILDFETTEDAEDFMDAYFSSATTRASNNTVFDQHGLSAFFDTLEHGRVNRDQAAEWYCEYGCPRPNFGNRTRCNECSAPRSDTSVTEPPRTTTANRPYNYVSPRLLLTGEQDACPRQAPSAFLVVYPFDDWVSESTLADRAAELYKSEESKATSHDQGVGPAPLRSTAAKLSVSTLGAPQGSIRRVFIIREARSARSCGYGIIEFFTPEDARASLEKCRAMRQFIVGSKAVTVAFAHNGVWLPETAPVTTDTARFSFPSTANPELRLKYWNPALYASEYVVHAAPSNVAKPSNADKAAKASKKRKAAEREAEQNGKKTASAMAPQMQSWATKWTNKHAELHGGSQDGSHPDGTREPHEAAANEGGGNGSEVPSTAAQQSTSSKPVAVVLSYADPDDLCCLLCARKFKSAEQLQAHEDRSELHQTNLQSDERKEKAIQGLAKRGKKPRELSQTAPSAAGSSSQATQYRDRAKERREAFNQPSKPLPPSSNNGNGAGALPTKSEGAKPFRFELEKKSGNGAADHQKAKAGGGSGGGGGPSKGAAMLGKMGWKAGAGLGAEGAGRTEILATDAYVPGAGLGVQGGKIGDAGEAAQNNTTDRYDDFIAKTREKARERYESLG